LAFYKSAHAKSSSIVSQSFFNIFSVAIIVKKAAENKISDISRATAILKSELYFLISTEALQNNIKRLAAGEDFFRLRVGSYRVIFKKEDRRLLILIIRIGHRKEIYLSLKSGP